MSLLTKPRASKQPCRRDTHHHAVDEAAPVAVARLEAFLPLRLDLVVVSLDEAVQGSLLGPARLVDAGSGALCGQGQLPSAAWTDRLRMTSTTTWVKGLAEPGGQSHDP